MRTLAFVVLVAGCAREAEPRLCPDVTTGDLVITEVRKTSSNDTLGAWVELYNASSGELDIRGMELRFRRKDGSGETDVVVRHSLPVAAGGYLTLGLFPDASISPLPDHIDYGFAGDFTTGFPSASTLDLEACGELVDRASYDSLPSMGSYALGTTPPSANDNDLPANWCTDSTMVGTTYPGTPKAANHPCP
ncbi:MAG: lamin tail domain-containing protein [Proteobacteria bacterium]|nr:lamin tail domain-containing protein [Pseudomonadota bacterium]